ncbi:uncharacterized protein LOC131937858 [Physella acuta]|uniref:uncharacterized protein LOC131937858 n=1 Tax=Physella acuta TaxID=109671 RepID=UPI0027DC612A|nr:uncharacterized protein LOC131937858 [Physella acuta]XP_059151537.1 uncharacterized protein LOC131937858 [Physella acuta]XP_059151538.1 uncharacterized protein LOC131937858 [Physella acuta]
MFYQVLLTALTVQCLHVSSQELCSLPTKPCKSRVETKDEAGNLVDDVYYAECRCRNGVVCPEFNVTHKMVSVDLPARRGTMTMNLIFCETSQPVRYCNHLELALLLSGNVVPTHLEQTRTCRCPDNDVYYPLQTSYQQYRPFVWHVCKSHLAVCSRHQSCSRQSANLQVNTCRCPQGYTCTAIGDSTACTQVPAPR